VKYRDFVIEASEATLARDPVSQSWLRSFKVRAVRTPDQGEMTPAAAVTSQCDELGLQTQLRALETRQIDRDGLFKLGRVLGLLLLPPAQSNAATSVRELFRRSLDAGGPEMGLRLRLQLPPELSALPWEYMYLDRTGSADESMLGFLALDPRIAIIRHEALPVPPLSPAVSGDLSVLAALASPPDLELLQLDVEEKVLHQALDGQPGITLGLRKNATLEAVQNGLAGANVFHFAGHGGFVQQAGAKPGTLTGTGFIALDDQRIDAETLGVNLRGNGIRLAVLGGCETGRRAGTYVWGGVAPALARAEIPAVVANQYSILDSCAIAFTRKFYAALAGGLPLESAVQAGRIEAYNTDRTGRDWGVPVLYLRAAEGTLFEGAANPAVRANARAIAEADVKVRVEEVAAGGFLTGAKVREFVAGKLNVSVVIGGTVHGEVVGFEAGSVGSGSINVDVSADTVEDGGSVYGTVLDVFGEPPASPGTKRSAPRPARSSSPAGAGNPELERFSWSDTRGVEVPPSVSANVDVKTVNGGQVVGTQQIDRSVHGDNINVATLNKGIDGKNVTIRNVTIYQGSTPTGAPPNERQIEEALRLDVALPKTAVVEEPFDLVVQVKRPDSPKLSIADLDQVVSAEGSVFRSEDSELVRYRIEVSGAGFQAAPPHFVIQLRPKSDSFPVAFQVTATKTGRRSLLVNAFQDNGALAAQTRVTVEAMVAVKPG
jgi:hypothetical protein